MKVRTATLTAVIMTITAMLLTTGCGKNETLSDEDEIRSLLGNSYLVGKGSYFDDGEGTSGVLSVVGTESDSFDWYRHIDRPIPLNIIVNVIGDSAYAYVEYEITGIFGNTVIGFTKPINSLGNREVWLENDPSNGTWHITKITPWDIPSETVDTPRIEWVELPYVRWGLNPSFTFYSPDTIIPKEDLPGWKTGDTVIVKVKVSNPNGESEVFLHPNNNRVSLKKFYDDGGVSGSKDEEAGDGIFTQWWVAGEGGENGEPIWKNGFVDVIDSETINDSTAPYRSNVWGLPYFISNDGSLPAVD